MKSIREDSGAESQGLKSIVTEIQARVSVDVKERKVVMQMDIKDDLPRGEVSILKNDQFVSVYAAETNLGLKARESIQNVENSLGVPDSETTVPPNCSPSMNMLSLALQKSDFSTSLCIDI